LQGREDLGFETLREKEQFWMLLIPTYNRSFVIGSNEGLPISEERRQILSTLIYIYEISDKGRLVLNSEQQIFLHPPCWAGCKTPTVLKKNRSWYKKFSQNGNCIF